MGGRAVSGDRTFWRRGLELSPEDRQDPREAGRARSGASGWRGPARAQAGSELGLRPPPGEHARAQPPLPPASTRMGRGASSRGGQEGVQLSGWPCPLRSGTSVHPPGRPSWACLGSPETALPSASAAGGCPLWPGPLTGQWAAGVCGVQPTPPPPPSAQDSPPQNASPRCPGV